MPSTRTCGSASAWPSSRESRAVLNSQCLPAAAGGAALSPPLSDSHSASARGKEEICRVNLGGALTAAGQGHSQGKAMAAITNPAWLLQGTALSVCTTSAWGKNWGVTPCHQVLGLFENLSFYHERHESNRTAVDQKNWRVLQSTCLSCPWLGAGKRRHMLDPGRRKAAACAVWFLKFWHPLL